MARPVDALDGPGAHKVGLRPNVLLRGHVRWGEAHAAPRLLVAAQVAGTVDIVRGGDTQAAPHGCACSCRRR